MAKVIYAMGGVSADGYVVGPDGRFDWAVPDEELHRFHNEQTRALAGHLLGRRLYETMVYWETAENDPSDVAREFAAIWQALPKVVFSRTLDSVEGVNTRLARGDLRAELAALLTSGDVAVGGPELAAEAARLGLIDEYRLFVHPVAVGGGIPYFPRDHRVDLDLVERAPSARAWCICDSEPGKARRQMTHPSITITPIFVADLLAEGERMPVYVHVIEHPDARVLVDTGLTELHPAAADMDPRIRPLSEQDFDLDAIDIVVSTHLHFDHCGGNHLFAGKPIYVQRQELEDARTQDDYTIREWVDPPGVEYVAVDGEFELLPGLRLVPAPGHTRGMQVVVVETGGRPLVVGGDVAVWFGELDEPHSEGQLRVLGLDPELVWLAHEHEPWRPPAS